MPQTCLCLVRSQSRASRTSARTEHRAAVLAAVRLVDDQPESQEPDHRSLDGATLPDGARCEFAHGDPDPRAGAGASWPRRYRPGYV